MEVMIILEGGGGRAIADDDEPAPAQPEAAPGRP
jgi:hypothetical protein